MANRKSPVPPVRPVQRETVIEMVARRVESLVRSGDLSRGSRLPSEPRLAEMLQVSRASLREALKGLVFIGLLKARPGDGTYLQPSLTSMASRHLQWMLLLEEIKYLELYELREILEPAAAALAARRATPDDLEQMQAALSGMKRTTNDPESFIRYEMEFHNAITRASKNGAMQSTMQMMYGALSEGRHRVLPLVQNMAHHCARHENMFLLIAKRDATGARHAVIADVKYAESLLQENLQKLQNQKGESSKGTKMSLKAAKKSSRKTATRKVKLKQDLLETVDE
ncbi:FadR/GntR family transcriptional regulator [Edaphobacter bradus]|uniref:FadR/GntR family transcriptional regulator n=1 Tax=Edaphobacter bradus TaxID=2259016 RepID=UPI0021E01D77|nr:FadR/GntR family transcriptional regulator [Edaphobacter bradus]